MAEDHYIEYVWAKNQDGVVEAAVHLKLSATAELDFDVPEGTTSITGFESCNKSVSLILISLLFCSSPCTPSKRL
jgi:desulfoferrodoxin (superoxide reductase-like protein)